MRDVRCDFPILDREIDGRPLIYLDSGATSLKPRVVIDAVTACYTHHTSNVHRAVHLLGEEATEAFEAARAALARFLGANDDELIFVRGTTEAINLVRHCYPGLRRVAVTIMEHHSNLLPWWAQAKPIVIGVDGLGRIDMEALDKALKQGVDLVAVSHVSNVLGSISPIETIIAKAHAAGALVLVDAAQSVPHMRVNCHELGVDFLACSGHKMLGPGGTGVLFGRHKLLEKMQPWQLGGQTVESVHLEGFELKPAPYRFEAGTPAIEAVIGWGAAATYVSDLGMAQVARHDHDLVAYALKSLAEIKGVRLIGSTDAAARCGSVTFQVDGIEAHGVARILSNRGNIMVRSGFLCAQPLHEWLGLTPTVRASFHIYNCRQDIDALAQHLKAIVAFI